MAQVQKQIVSSQKFLAGLTSLAHYAELRRKQADRLESLIRKNVVTVEQSGSILQCLDDSVWDNETMSKLKAAVADQTDQTEEVEASSRRARQQDYSALPKYLSPHWWRLLEGANMGEEEKTLELLCSFAAKLGLQNPTEETYAFLFLLGGTLHLRNPIYDCEKVKLLTKWKPVMKRHLSRAACPPLRPLLLPDKWEECPDALLRAAYPDGFQPGVPSHQTLEQIMQLGKTWPLRTSNVVAQSRQFGTCAPAASSVDVIAVASAVAREVSRSVTFQAAPSAVAAEPDLPGLKIFSKAVAPDQHQQNQLALMDQIVESEEKPPQKLDPSASTPQAMIDKIRADLEMEKKAKTTPKEPKEKKNKKTGTKKPVSKKAMLKRPAAASSVLRRPAAAGLAQQEPDPTRRALLELIPTELLQRYAGGCSRCYHRKFCTVSCWGRRGYRL